MVTIAGAPLWIAQHPAHPCHVLKLVATGGAVFHCDGCRQYGNDEHRYCDACGDEVLGFMFYDGAHLDLHPRCASLPERLAGEGGVLNRCKQAPARVGCRLCEQGQDGQGRSKFWCYSFHDGEPAYMHVACIMEARYGHGQAAPTVGEVQRGHIGMPSPFQRFYSLALTLARITYVVATLDPTGIFTAFADF